MMVIFCMFLDIYVPYLTGILTCPYLAVSNNTDNIYLRGLKSEIKRNKQIALTQLAAFTIF